MPVYRVTVTATYPPQITPELLHNLNAWASTERDRSVESDFGIDPPRHTAKAIYRLDAASEDEAERQAYERFAAEQVDAGIAGPETILAIAG